MPLPPKHRSAPHRALPLRFWLACLGLGSSLLLSAADTPAPFTVDAGYPGGNIVVEQIAGDIVRLHQDLRDTDGDWFYWNFRVRGAQGRTLTFQFTKSQVLGVRGPAVSTDGGLTWSWLGHPGNNKEFSYTFAAKSADTPASGTPPSPRTAGRGQSQPSVAPSSLQPHHAPDEVRFAFAMPYLESDLAAFLARQTSRRFWKREVLCRTAKGREVEMLRVGRVRGQPDHRILLTARHHACESMASYALEGLLEFVLTDRQDGAWLRQHTEILAVPFMDKDGVEDGDQGKNRKPHDHNRDYLQRQYPSVRALTERAPAWSRQKLQVAIDLHCPHIRGTHNEVLYFVGGPDAGNWERVSALARTLEAVRQGPLPYSATNNLPFGQAWNTGPKDKTLMSFGAWAAGLPGIRVGTSLEIPYANVSGVEVNAGSARAFGRDLARALRRFLDEQP